MPKFSITIHDIDLADLQKVVAALGGPERAAAHITAAPAPVTVTDSPRPTAAAAVAIAATAPAAMAPETRDAGDDTPKARPGDDVFMRCSVLKEVIKEIVRRDVREEKAILAECQRLQEVGVPALKPIDPAKLAERVHVSLIALGVIDG